MKYLILLCCVVAAAVADTYTDKFDNLDVMEMMKNKRFVEGIAECLRGNGPCTQEGKTLKDHLQDALATGCEKCTNTQKEKTPEVIRYIIKHEPVLWTEATQKYDPEGKYKKMYEEEARKYEINL